MNESNPYQYDRDLIKQFYSDAARRAQARRDAIRYAALILLTIAAWFASVYIAAGLLNTFRDEMPVVSTSHQPSPDQPESLPVQSGKPASIRSSSNG